LIKIRPLVFIFFLACVFLHGLDVSSGGPLSKSQASMDVKHYFLDLRVDPHKKSISGTSTIQFILKEDTPVLEIDLYKNFTISGVSIDGTSLDFKHQENKVFIENLGFELFVLHKLEIKYGGRPPVAKRPPWDGGFTWEKSQSGDPWVGVSCQGNGAYIWYPCKEHPSDKADSADIKITAPDPVMAVSNGLLFSKQKTGGRWTTWHWKTKYPISTYNINFTLGNYEIVEKEGYVLDEPLKIIYYVLPEAKKGAMELLNMSEEYLNFYANHFGQYPWIKEKFGLVHAPYWGMEHQTINAYGNEYKKTKLGYDFILFHEMGHEWFGNYLSVADWSEFWIHEGFDTYAEALFVEEKYGWNKAVQFVKDRYKNNIKNEFPILMGEDGTSRHPSGNDVYYKGAHVLHTLRFLIGDKVFKSSIKEFVQMPKELGGNQTSTKEFIALVNENTNLDLQWFFDVYIYQNKLPVLNVKKTKEDKATFLDLWWENKDFEMPIEISYNALNGKVKRKLFINKNPIRIALLSNEQYVLDPEGWILFAKNYK
tara:strand:+ start:84 stop:1697 length:1614 start_codon:yes stop_codon:yes gene_type:complete